MAILRAHAEPSLGWRGQGLGIGSWYQIVAVVAVVAAISGCQGAAARPPRPPTLTVARLGPGAADGVIAAGHINGRAWRIRLTLARQRSCGPRPGWAVACVETVGFVVERWRLERPDPVRIWTFSPVLFGPVRPDVTLVSMRLSDGSVVRLHPVRAFGHRWIGIVLPPRLTPVAAVAYAGRRDLVHAVPYVGPAPGASPGSPEVAFLSWLPPGDDGPARVTKTVRGRGMTLVLRTGPWGNWLGNQGAAWDFPLGFRPSEPALQGGGGLPQPVPMAFPWPAKYLVLTLADGTRERIPLVLGAGLGFAIVTVTARPAVLRWDVYDRLGKRLSGGKGPPGGPYP
jgi:hypothetical protein